MSLGAVVLNWNQADDTIACVRELITILEPDDIVWVVDNASRADDAARIGAACRGARLLPSDRNLGFGGGNNLAIREILKQGATEVLLLNNDARIAKEDLSRLRSALSKRPDLAVVGPLLYDGDKRDRLLSAGGRDIARHVVTHERVLPDNLPARHPETVGHLTEVDYVPGTCALLSVDVLSHVGLLEEEYFFAGEMADLCHRARLAGRPSAVLSGARAFHFTARSSGHRDELYLYYVLRNRFLYVRRNHPKRFRKLRIDWTMHGLRFWLEALSRGERRRARALRKAVVDGWSGRFGDRNRAILKDRSA